MRGAIFGSPVGLDLDDARFAPAGLVVTDEPHPEQTRCDLLGRAGQVLSVDDAQAGALA